MGLQSSLNDVSSDSIPLLMVAIVAHWVGYLRSLLFGFIHSIGLSRIDADEAGNGIYGAAGSGLAGIIVLAEQLNMNRTSAYGYRRGEGRGGVGTVGGSDYCVVCLCRLADGDRVRRLPCRHVFHKECLDGWLDRLNWNCPLCRSPLVSEHHIADARRRVSLDLATWFPLP